MSRVTRLPWSLLLLAVATVVGGCAATSGGGPHSQFAHPRQPATPAPAAPPEAEAAPNSLLAAVENVPHRLPPIGVQETSTPKPLAVMPVQFVTEVEVAEPHPLPGPRSADELPATSQPPSKLPPGEIVAAPPTGPVYGTSRVMPLDFASALGLTQGQNPRVAFAQAQVAQAYAQNQAARVMWLPSLRAGMNYNKHEGRIQNVEGQNIEVSRAAAYGGFGANAVGAGSPAIPGLYLQFHATDAIFQRQITGYALSARQFQSSAVTNDQLLETALAYLALLNALQGKAIAAETLQHGQALVDLTANFARTGAGNEADADRATAALGLLRNEAARADEGVAVASARLAQQISADPSLLIVPQEPAVVPIEMVSPELFTADLIATGLTNRPELAASRALVCEAVNRLRREQNAPWLPSVVLGLSYGAFGAGTGDDITNTSDRLDFDAVAWWEIRNMGFGEAAARANASAQIQQARMREVEVMDLVAREVVEAKTQVEARRKQIAVAQQGIESAQKSYERNLDRIRNAQGLPIEVLQSIQALDASRRDYLRAVIDYNQAQFRLQRALGWPVAPPAL